MMPRKSAKVYRVSCQVREKYQVEIKAREHLVIADEPKPYGDNEGMTPVELLLGALGACKTMVFKVYAAQKKLSYDACSIEVEGDFDSAGYLGDPTVPIGFSEIRTTYHLTSVATRTDIDEVIAHVESHCPVASTIDVAPRKAVEVKLINACNV